MNIPLKIQEYVWLMTILRNKKLTFAEINEMWVDNEDLSAGVDMARSTFNRHLEAISTMFGIYVECDKHDGYRYYIANATVLKDNTIQNWILSTLSVNSLIGDSHSIQDRILLEPVRVEGDYLQQVIQAIKQNRRLEVSYKKYGTDLPKTLNFEPYCLKLYKQRWYVLGHFHRDATEDHEELDYFGLFSFDRIQEMKVTDVTFTLDPDFDAKTFFSECFGVVVNDFTPPETIRLRAYNYERFYMKDLPIHASQTVISEGENYTDFELFMRPTLDFNSYLMSRANVLKVLSPQWLADEIHDLLLDALELSALKP